MASDIIASA